MIKVRVDISFVVIALRVVKSIQLLSFLCSTFPSLFFISICLPSYLTFVSASRDEYEYPPSSSPSLICKHADSTLLEPLAHLPRLLELIPTHDLCKEYPEAVRLPGV